jgi:hypothetical protein
LGVDWIFHPLPLIQRSARVPRAEPPTASQAFGPGHETPFRKELVDPVGLGVDWTFQPLPLIQRSTNVSPLPEVFE